MLEPRQEIVSDLLNIQGQDIPGIDAELDALLALGRSEPVMILPGASKAVFGDQMPYAQTRVSVTFEEEDDLRRCV